MCYLEISIYYIQYILFPYGLTFLQCSKNSKDMHPLEYLQLKISKSIVKADSFFSCNSCMMNIFVYTEVPEKLKTLKSLPSF